VAHPALSADQRKYLLFEPLRDLPVRRPGDDGQHIIVVVSRCIQPHISGGNIDDTRPSSLENSRKDL
jgi:hypothetical protein